MLRSFSGRYIVQNLGKLQMVLWIGMALKPENVIPMLSEIEVNPVISSWSSAFSCVEK